jgi:hypothetical protein
MNKGNAEKQRVFLVGVGRNIEATIVNELKNLIEVIGQPLYKTLIIESDSTDETLRRLSSFSIEKANFHFVSLGNLRESIPSRTARIAFCRNAYMDFLDAEARDDDLVVIADLDGANRDLTKSRLAAIWEREDWDACTANQQFAYFDIWALRAEGWSEVDWVQEYDSLVAGGMSPRKALKNALYKKMIKINDKSEWISVDSAFGGLGIYRYKAIRGLRYKGELNGREICEHVPFHLGIRERGGEIFIVPRLINCEYSSHTEILKKSVKLKTQIVKIRENFSSKLDF